MRSLFLFFLCFVCYLFSPAQADEQTFVVKAKPKVTVRRDTTHKTVEIYWRWRTPMHDGQEQEEIARNFKGLKDGPRGMDNANWFSYRDSFSYQDSSLFDSIDHKYDHIHDSNYKSLDVTITQWGKTRSYHSISNYFNGEMDDAFRKMMPGAKLVISLHRTTLLGENKTDTLIYHIVSLARGWSIKRANTKKFKYGIPAKL